MDTSESAPTDVNESIESKSHDTSRVKRRRRARGVRRKILKNVTFYLTCTLLLAAGIGYWVYNQLEHNHMNTPIQAASQEDTRFSLRNYKQPDAVYEAVRRIFPEMSIENFELSYTLLPDGRMMPSEIHFFLPTVALESDLLPSPTMGGHIAQTAKPLTMSYSISRVELGDRLARLTETLLHENIVRCQSYTLGNRENMRINSETETEWVKIRYDLNIGC